MPTGDSCPECGGRVRTDNGTDYECRDCGREYDSLDLFVP